MATTKASRRNANQKTVFCTASENVVKTAKAVMVMFIASLLIVACAKENINPKPAAVGSLPQDTTKVIIDHFANSQRSLFVNVTPKDSFCLSVGKFDMYSTMSFTSDDNTLYDMKLTPTANVRIELTPARQEVKSEAEIPTTKVSSKTISQSKTNNGLLYVYKKHQQDTYADGSKADIYLEWTARGYQNADGDTLMTGHVEFGEIKLDSLSYARHGERTEYDDPFYVTHHYTIPYTEKGVTGQQRSFVLPLKPYREKSITDDPQVKTGEPTYKIDWVGCPVTKLNLVQTTPTNKGNVVVKESFDVVFKVTAPEEREQASLDSLFAKTSKGELKYSVLGDSVRHDNGFISLNYSGSYTSRNKGLENGSNVESSATIVASMPVKFSNKWGSVNINSLEPSFEEGGFEITSISQDADFHTFKTVNTIIPKLGDCTLDALDEVVKIKVGKEKAEIWVDSTFVKSGAGDVYTIDATWYGSKGSKRQLSWSYDGRHSASATNFGEKITSSLNWSASDLKDNGSSKDVDKKEIDPITRFEATYFTNNKKSDASNGIESGSFGFSETHPVVTFVHGETKITFDERKVILTAQPAVPAANYNVVVRDGVSYKGYTYNMTAGVVFDGAAETDVTSQGLLMMVADQIGDTTYKDEYVWNGNMLTATVTKTIDHTFADDEVETYTKAVTVSMSDLQDGRIDAENTNFSVTATPSEQSNEDGDGFWTIKKRVRNYTYDVSNGSASRQMTNEVVDYTLTFNDGTHSHTFDASLNVSKADNFGSAYTEGDYTVTPLTTTVTAVATGTGAPTISQDGVTSIYVENKKEITWKLTYTVDEVDGGNVYVDLTFQRLINGQVNKTWKHWGLGGMFGQYKPDVEMIYVTDTKFSDNYSTTEHATDPSVYDLGDEKAYTLDNISKIEDHFSVLFNANADADGNTTREVAGHVNRWSYRYTAVDKEYNHSESIDLVVTTKTTVHNVENGVYTRTIEYQLNGVTVATQTGKVNVTVQ